MIARKTRAVLSIWLVLLILSSIFSNRTNAEQKVIKLAIWPCTKPMKVYRQYCKLAKFLSEETGMKIKLIIPDNTEKFFALVKDAQTDFAFQDAAVYLQLAENYNPGYLLQALNPSGKPTEKGTVIVRKDSGIKSIKQLKGKKMLFGDKYSLTKYLTIKKLFLENGIDIDKDLVDYSFGRDCEGIALRVYLKKADAGAIDSWSWEEFQKENEQIDSDKLLVIAEGIEVPYWVFTAHKKTDEGVIEKVEHILLKLNRMNLSHQEILLGPEIGGFIKAKDTDYNQTRAILR